MTCILVWSRLTESFLSDSRTFGLKFQNVLLIDSTAILLFNEILENVARNPKGDCIKKGGLKVHMLIDAVQQVGRLIKVTVAKSSRQEFSTDIGVGEQLHDRL